MTRGQRWRGDCPQGRAVALALCLLMPVLAARAQAPDAGLSDAAVPAPAPVEAELDVQRTDAGWSVDTGTAAGPGSDAGVPQQAFVPPSLVADSPAAYPPQLAGEGVAGVVKLELLLDEAGEVESATLVEALHPQLDRAALHAAPLLRFSPATLDGQPVQVRLFFEYRFEAPTPVASADGGVPDGPVTLRGLVRTKGNRRPIPGATLLSDMLPDAPVQTDGQGRFEARWPVGTHRVRVMAPGHKPFVFRETLNAKEALEVMYGLEPTVINPYETVVRGDRERTEVSRVTLQDAELREVPGTMGDPFRVVMLMPGVGSMLSGVAYPVVRGSQPASTGYFLDGIRVPILFHLFLGPAVIHPDFIDAIDFYPGTPPPKYGRLMGGAIDGRLTRPRDDGVHGSAYADLINAGFFIETPFEDTGTNVSLAGRYSYTPWIIALAANSLQSPPAPGRQNPKVVLDFWDYQGRVEQDVGRGKLRLFAFGSSDTFGTEAQDAFGDTALQSIIFHRVDLRYRHPVGAGEFEIGGTWGLDRFSVVNSSGLGDEEDANGIYIDQGTFAGRLGYTLPVNSRLTLRAGGDVDYKRAIVDLVQASGDGEAPVESAPVAIGTFMGAYVEAVWQPDDKWSVVPGLRVDNYHLSPGIDRSALEPRLTVRRKLSEKLTLKGGVGLFHQPPTSLISLPVIDVGSLLLGLQEGVQISMGAEWKAWRDLEVGLDLYVNPMLRTVELTPFSDEGLVDEVEDEFPDDGEVTTTGVREARAQRRAFQLEDDGPLIPSRDDIDFPDFTSHGLAYGMELLIRHPLGNNWFGWLSYSLQRSTRYTKFYRYDAEGNVIGEDEADLPFVFDQTHILNLVLSYKFSNGFTAGAVAHFNTGRPEAGSLGTATHREGQIAGRASWVRADRDRVDRLPGFMRFDVRLSKAWVYDSFNLEAYLDMLNVTISRETVGYEYNGGGGRKLTKEAVGLPIVLPILGVKGRY
jgi:TonB family protein